MIESRRQNQDDSEIFKATISQKRLKVLCWLKSSSRVCSQFTFMLLGLAWVIGYQTVVVDLPPSKQHAPMVLFFTAALLIQFFQLFITFLELYAYRMQWLQIYPRTFVFQSVETICWFVALSYFLVKMTDSSDSLQYSEGLLKYFSFFFTIRMLFLFIVFDEIYEIDVILNSLRFSRQFGELCMGFYLLYFLYA